MRGDVLPLPPYAFMALCLITYGISLHDMVLKVSLPLSIRIIFNMNSSGLDYQVL